MLLKTTVTFAPAGTVIVVLSNVRFCALRLMVMFLLAEPSVGVAIMPVGVDVGVLETGAGVGVGVGILEMGVGVDAGAP